jgi:subfamily B ATP-binding cassette protein HlyB/CyaB
LDESQNPTSRPQGAPAERFDSGLQALTLIAGYYRIAAQPSQLAHDLGLAQRAIESGDLVRAAQRLGLRARVVQN